MKLTLLKEVLENHYNFVDNPNLPILIAIRTAEEYLKMVFNTVSIQRVPQLQFYCKILDIRYHKMKFLQGKGTTDGYVGGSFSQHTGDLV